MTDDYYGVLGIDAQADTSALRKAWRRLALRWHPDRAGADATATFQKIQAAYTVLSDPVARAAYDRRQGASVHRERVDSTRQAAPAVMLSRLCGPLNALLAQGAAEEAADDVIELFLNTQEASEGGMVVISMRVAVRCPACEAGVCARCGTSRTVEELFSAWLAVPPGISDGAVLAPSALLPGMIRAVSFRVRVH